MKPSELLSKPGAWCQGNLARDAKDEIVDCEEQVAVKWCVLGAIAHCLRTDTSEWGEAASDASTRLRKVLGRSNLANWNDDPARTQDEVVAALRKAGL